MLFGANTVAIKICLNEIGPFTTAAIRFALAALVLTLWIAKRGHSLRLRSEQLIPIGVIATAFTIQIMLLYIGLNLTSASRGVLLVNMQPFWVLLLAHFFIPGDHITGRKVLGLVAGFSGVACLFLAPDSLSSPMHRGDLIIMVVALIWAANAVYTKRVIHAFSPYQLVLYPMFLALPCIVVAACWWETLPSAAQFNVQVNTALLYQSLITTAIGFVAWNRLLKIHGAVALHAYIFVIPMAGVLISRMLLGEPLTVQMLIAMSLIVSGIIIIQGGLGRLTAIMPNQRNL
jgi:drug/metabolite transporter (DMT)-like permease